jgi:AraC family transcriptional regulator, ethanolamine operon transcriptional activator
LTQVRNSPAESAHDVENQPPVPIMLAVSAPPAAAVSPAPTPATTTARSGAWQNFPEADELATAFRGTQLRITPKSRASGTWSLLPLALERGFVQFADEPCGTLTYGSVSRDIAGFGVALNASGNYRMNGFPVSGNVFALFGPGAAQFGSSSGPSRWAAVSFAPIDLGAALGALRGGDSQPLGTVFRPILASPAIASAAVDLLFSALRTVERDPDALAAPGARVSLERALLDTFARAVASADPHAVADRAKLPATRLVRQCEDYLETHLHTPVYVADLCTLTGASERTLRNAFHTVYGLGPTRYLVQRRLAAARRALRHAQPGDTVTSIATRNGLWDLGRFAADYRALYGEPPSATLRAARAGTLAA